MYVPRFSQPKAIMARTKQTFWKSTGESCQGSNWQLRRQENQRLLLVVSRIPIDTSLEQLLYVRLEHTKNPQSCWSESCPSNVCYVTFSWLQDRFAISIKCCCGHSRSSRGLFGRLVWEYQLHVSSLCAFHAKRVTIMPKDNQLALRIGGERA